MTDSRPLYALEIEDVEVLICVFALNDREAGHHIATNRARVTGSGDRCAWKVAVTTIFIYLFFEIGGYGFLYWLINFAENYLCRKAGWIKPSAIFMIVFVERKLYVYPLGFVLFR